MKIAVVPIFENWARARFPPSRSVEMQSRTDLDMLNKGTTERAQVCEQSHGRCRWSIGVTHTDFADQSGVAVGRLPRSERVSRSGGRGGERRRQTSSKMMRSPATPLSDWTRGCARAGGQQNRGAFVCARVCVCNCEED